MGILSPSLYALMQRSCCVSLGIGLGVVVGSSGSAQALPMSYAGSTTVAIDVDPHWSSLWLSKAVSRRQGLGYSVTVLPANSSHGRHQNSDLSAGSHAVQGDEVFALLESTRLLHRWNLPKAQGNAWFFAGIGAYQASGTPSVLSTASASAHPFEKHHRHAGGDGDSATFGAPPSLRVAARPGVQLDIETTRLRLEGRALLYLAPGIQRALLSATAGAALTPPHYNRVQPWLEVQMRAMPGVTNELELIPKVRLLHQRLVFEVGYSTRGTMVGGMTYTF